MSRLPRIRFTVGLPVSSKRNRSQRKSLFQIKVSSCTAGTPCSVRTGFSIFQECKSSPFWCQIKTLENCSVLFNQSQHWSASVFFYYMLSFYCQTACSFNKAVITKKQNYILLYVNKSYWETTHFDCVFTLFIK